MAIANQYGIDLPAIQQGWDATGQNALRALIMGKQLDQYNREAETQGILDKNTTAALGGDQQALGAITARKPELGTAIMTRLAALDKDKRDTVIKQAPIVARMFGAVNDQASYSRAVEGLNAAGVSTAKLPMQYDPEFVRSQLITARAIAPQKYDIKEGDSGFYAINPEDPSAAPVQVPGIRPKGNGDDRQLVEIYDERSPTGTRFVPRSQAAGMPGKPASGLAMRTNADGTVEIVQGRNAGSQGFGLKATNDIETNIVNTQMRIARIGDILGAFNPNFLTYEGRIKNWGRGVLDKIAPGSLGPDDKKELTDFATFRARAYNDLNQTLKDISGAAVTPQEAARNLKVIGNAEEDSPTVFQAKVKEIYRNLRMAQARLSYMRANGIADMKDVPLEKMPSLMKSREEALAFDVAKQNPGMAPDKLKDEVRARLQKEFGL